MESPEAVLMYVAHVATEDHVDVLGSGLPPDAMFISMICVAAVPMVRLLVYLPLETMLSL